MIDCGSRRLPGWAITHHMGTELVEDALKAAAATPQSWPSTAIVAVFATVSAIPKPA